VVDGRAVAVPSECVRPGPTAKRRDRTAGRHTLGASLRVSGRPRAVTGRSSRRAGSSTARRVPPLGRRAIRRPAVPVLRRGG